MHPSAAHRLRQELAVAPGRVEKLPKEPQTWKTTRRVGKSFANGWRFRRTSDRRQIRPRPSPKGPSRRTSFSAAAASRTAESWDGCCRASAGRDRSSRPIRLERFSPLARSVSAMHAAKLVVEPNFQILRRHRRSLLLRREHAHRSAVENHVYRPPRLGSRRSLNLNIGINVNGLFKS